MPVYGFKCEACQARVDETRPMARAGEPGACDVCGGVTRRTYDDPTAFLFRASGYHLREGERGYDSHFQVREAHTKQWVDTVQTRKRKYEEGKRS